MARMKKKKKGKIGKRRLMLLLFQCMHAFIRYFIHSFIHM